MEMNPRKFEDSQTLAFRCSKKTFDHLRGIAMSFTQQQGKLYTVSELIRDTLEQIFPTPKQLDLFENVDKDKRTSPSKKNKSHGKKSIS
jgi:hypothetical protein